MKLPYKITMISVGITVIASVLGALTSYEGIRSWWEYYAFFAIIAGAISMIICLLSFVAGEKYYGQAYGFLLSTALLLTSGFFALSQINDNEFGR